MRSSRIRTFLGSDIVGSGHFRMRSSRVRTFFLLDLVPDLPVHFFSDYRDSLKLIAFSTNSQYNWSSKSVFSEVWAESGLNGTEPPTLLVICTGSSVHVESLNYMVEKCCVHPGMEWIMSIYIFCKVKFTHREDRYYHWHKKYSLCALIKFIYLAKTLIFLHPAVQNGENLYADT
jgi:hypothetical protein